MDKTCIVEGCPDKIYCKGMCHRHYDQKRKHGEIIYPSRVMAPRNGIKMKSGYFYILKKEHPRADKRGYVKRSWLVWEENTGHIVTPPEVVHHKNENKIDDDFGNLKLLPNKKAHEEEHGGRIGGIRIVTREMAMEELRRCSLLVKGKLTTRKFDEVSLIGRSVIVRKFGWNSLKEELCIK